MDDRVNKESVCLGVVPGRHRQAVLSTLVTDKDNKEITEIRVLTFGKKGKDKDKDKSKDK